MPFSVRYPCFGSVDQTIMWMWGVVFLIVEGRPPAKVFGRDLHGLGQLRLVGQQELPPALAVFIAQPVASSRFRE